MKKIISAISAAVLTLFLVAPAQAGFLIEPYLGLSLAGSWENGADDGDATMTNYGLRLGMTTLGLMYGIDYGLGKVTLDDATDLDLTNTDLGVFVGYEFPILLRAYLTYYLQSTSDIQDGATLKGSGGLKIGVGYTGLPFVAINLEMIQQAYSEGEQGGVTADLADDVKLNLTMLSVSLPLP